MIPSVIKASTASRLATAKAADVLSIYIGKAGGIAPAWEMATAGRLPATIGSNLELGIGSAAMTHFALATPSVVAEAFPCDIIGPFYYEAELLTEPLSLQGGMARPPDRPGLGVMLDDAAVARYTVRT